MKKKKGMGMGSSIWKNLLHASVWVSVLGHPLDSASSRGWASVGLAWIAATQLNESFGRDLDFLESDLP